MVILRDARTSEHQALTVLAKEAKASWGYPDEWLAEWQDQLTVTAEYVRANRVVVAERDGRPVGFVSLEPGPPPEVGHLWVRSDLHGQGIGGSLLAGALALAQATGWTELQVVSDPNARPFYEKQGATLVGRVAAPVQGEDRSLPVLSLPVPQPQPA